MCIINDKLRIVVLKLLILNLIDRPIHFTALITLKYTLIVFKSWMYFIWWKCVYIYPTIHSIANWYWTIQPWYFIYNGIIAKRRLLRLDDLITEISLKLYQHSLLKYIYVVNNTIWTIHNHQQWYKQISPMWGLLLIIYRLFNSYFAKIKTPYYDSEGETGFQRQNNGIKVNLPSTKHYQPCQTPTDVCFVRNRTTTTIIMCTVHMHVNEKWYRN